MTLTRQTVPVCGSFAFPARPLGPSCLITSALEVPTRFSPPLQPKLHGAAFVALSSPTKTHRLRAVQIFSAFRVVHCPRALRVASDRSGLNFSLGVCPKICPSIDIRAACPLPARCHPEGWRGFRHRLAKACACSALAVSHGFNGLLHAARCRFVSPCSRTWGSPRFQCPCGCSFRRHRSFHIAVSHECFVPVAARRPPDCDSLASRPSRVSKPAAPACSAVLPHWSRFLRPALYFTAGDSDKSVPPLLKPRSAPSTSTFPGGAPPSEAFPSPAASPRHRDYLPSRHWVRR